MVTGGYNMPVPTLNVKFVWGRKLVSFVHRSSDQELYSSSYTQGNTPEAHYPQLDLISMMRSFILSR